MTLGRWDMKPKLLYWDGGGGEEGKEKATEHIQAAGKDCVGNTRALNPGLPQQEVSNSLY